MKPDEAGVDPRSNNEAGSDKLTYGVSPTYGGGGPSKTKSIHRIMKSCHSCTAIKSVADNASTLCLRKIPPEGITFAISLFPTRCCRLWYCYVTYSSGINGASPQATLKFVRNKEYLKLWKYYPLAVRIPKEPEEALAC